MIAGATLWPIIRELWCQKSTHALKSTIQTLCNSTMCCLKQTLSFWRSSRKQIGAIHRHLTPPTCSLDEYLLYLGPPIASSCFARRMSGSRQIQQHIRDLLVRLAHQWIVCRRHCSINCNWLSFGGTCIPPSVYLFELSSPSPLWNLNLVELLLAHFDCSPLLMWWLGD